MQLNSVLLSYRSRCRELKNPSLTSGFTELYGGLTSKFQENLTKPISDFIKSGARVDVIDREALGRQELRMTIYFLDTDVVMAD